MTRTVASPLLLGSADRNELLDIRQHRSTPQSIVLRINIVLGAAEGHANHALARELSTSLPTVLLWRRRYEAEGILGLLDDHPRSGRPKTITPDQEAAIVEATLRTQPPNATHWSVRTMAEDSGEGERSFRRERERHSGPKANSSRSVATLAFRLCRKRSASSRKTSPERSGGTASLAEKGVWGKGQQPFSPSRHIEARRASARRLRASTLFAHGVSTHFDAMGVVHQPVQDSVSGGGVADLFMPAGNRQLRGQDCRTGLIAIFADFPEVAAFRFCQRCHGPVVDHQHVNTA